MRSWTAFRAARYLTMSETPALEPCPDWCGTSMTILEAERDRRPWWRNGSAYCSDKCYRAGCALARRSPVPGGPPAFTHDTVAAWLKDRVAQYAGDSGYHAFVYDLVRGIRTGEVEAAFQHGELDDLMPAPAPVPGGEALGRAREMFSKLLAIARDGQDWPCVVLAENGLDALAAAPIPAEPPTKEDPKP